MLGAHGTRYTVLDKSSETITHIVKDWVAREEYCSIFLISGRQREFKHALVQEITTTLVWSKDQLLIRLKMVSQST